MRCSVLVTFVVVVVYVMVFMMVVTVDAQTDAGCPFVAYPSPFNCSGMTTWDDSSYGSSPTCAATQPTKMTGYYANSRLYRIDVTYYPSNATVQHGTSPSGAQTTTINFAIGEYIVSVLEYSSTGSTSGYLAAVSVTTNQNPSHQTLGVQPPNVTPKSLMIDSTHHVAVTTGCFNNIGIVGVGAQANSN